MDRSIDSILHDVRELDRDSRIAIAERILDEEAGPVDPKLEAAWRAEIRSRVAAHDRGEIKTVDAFESIAKARKMVADWKRAQK